jgi:hypothetical protein
MAGARIARGDVDPAGKILVRKLEEKAYLEHMDIHGRIVLEGIIYK